MPRSSMQVPTSWELVSQWQHINGKAIQSVGPMVNGVGLCVVDYISLHTVLGLLVNYSTQRRT